MNVSVVLLKKVMFMNKKGVELTINTVVIAVLAILVLVVLFYVFTNKFGGFTQQLNTCPSGPCVSNDVCLARFGTSLGTNYLDPITEKTCATDTLCCSNGP